MDIVHTVTWMSSVVSHLSGSEEKGGLQQSSKTFQCIFLQWLLRVGVWWWFVGVELMLCPEICSSCLYPLRCKTWLSPPSGQQHPHTCACAVFRAGRGETRPLWRGQQGPCPGHWACAGRRVSVGRFSDRPAGTGSRYQSSRLWKASRSGPWAGLGETLHSLSRSRTANTNKD